MIGIKTTTVTIIIGIRTTTTLIGNKATATLDLENNNKYCHEKQQQ
jgi:hypothetical protein